MKNNRNAWLTLAAALLIATTVQATLLIVDFIGETSIGKAAPRNGDAGLPPLKDGKILAADKWPNACMLVDEEDVKAILPDAEDLRQEQNGVYVPSIKDFAADSSWKESNSSDSGQCDYEMRLPGETYRATRLWVRVDAVADPKLIAAYDREVALGHSFKQSGADACVINGLIDDSWTCRKGPLMFTVGGHTTATFEGQYDAAPFIWRDKVTPEFVRTVTAKVR
ncbi:hypothetical protein [Streptomyces natalensis]|uniref:Lipoprotein n=1 Tax=Streptomyces natalensis ATCC 27448 TaxID=1240678 RepID=A0A0D7CGI2_9ACTN|nr:hypothetical protein [Streptomyces natalensis]KIZ15364.1 hypothetical protein SNA_27820 [Streptomyces natalensis ATCC 27448]